MLKYAIKKLLEVIPVLFAVATMTFFMCRFAPGGPFDTDKRVPDEILKNLNEKYHLNDPLYKQYFDYMTGLLHGDFGPSFKYPGKSVSEIILTGLPVTAELGFYALIVALVIGLAAGVNAAIKPNSLRDYAPMSAAMIGICMPAFLLGPTLVLFFSIYLGWLPVSGWDSFAHKILPSITLGTAYAAYIARLSRSGMLEILSQDFIRTARAKGVSEAVVIIRHALRGGLTPVVSFLGPAITGLLSGSFVVETVFQIPGLGRFFVQGAFNRDYTMIMGTTIFLAGLILIMNAVSDAMLVWMNPRLSFGGKGGK
ncbi:MAG: ABC transporter permease [Bacteriovoracia bacterium]